MNRFENVMSKLMPDESFVSRDRNIKLYDGDSKTRYEDGEILLTTHRLLWGAPGEISAGGHAIALHLKYVISLDEETASSFVFGKKKRIIVHLRNPDANKLPGPVDWSNASFIKISGRNGVDSSFVNALNETVCAKVWEVQEKLDTETKPPQVKLRYGIVGIERNLQQKQKDTDETISLAFQDLSKLMGLAKEMVNVSKSISTKITERQGNISEDETVRFKSYLMSLGIDDPVTRDTFQNNSEYFVSLGNQISQMLLDPIIDAGGMMALTEVYCRVNRARGLELISPEDLLNACQLLAGPIKLRTFPSGAMVLQLNSHDDDVVAEETAKQVEEAESLSIEQLASLLNVSILLAQERLFTSERAGRICRDESIAGIRFYPNLFLANAPEN